MVFEHLPKNETLIYIIVHCRRQFIMKFGRIFSFYQRGSPLFFLYCQFTLNVLVVFSTSTTPYTSTIHPSIKLTSYYIVKGLVCNANTL